MEYTTLSGHLIEDLEPESFYISPASEKLKMGKGNLGPRGRSNDPVWRKVNRLNLFGISVTLSIQ